MKELTAEELLKKLMQHFYIDSENEIHWSHIEGVSVNKFDPVLADGLLKYMPEEVTEE